MRTGNGGHPAEVACTGCHQATPEASHPAATGAVAGTTCLECHKVQAAPFLHPVSAAADCQACHRVHQSRGGPLLAREKRGLCLGCHQDLDRGKTANYHPGGDFCTDCHRPHGAARGDLLAKPYSTAAYQPFSVERYALCFGCHQVNLLQFPDTSFYTGFRNGRRNLHFLHVNKKNRGRNCLLCHDVHGSSAPRLIAETVGYGAWSMPIDFQATENGGSCFPGCHGPRRYDRTYVPPEGTPPAFPPAREPEDQLLRQQRPEQGDPGRTP